MTLQDVIYASGTFGYLIGAAVGVVAGRLFGYRAFLLIFAAEALRVVVTGHP